MGSVYRLMITALAAMVALPSIPSLAQDKSTGTLIVTALDCRGADVYDLETCVLAENVPFHLSDPDDDSDEFTYHRTGSDGTFTLQLTTEFVFVLRYSAEVAWSDAPVASLIDSDVIGLLPGEVMELTYILVEPDLAVAGDASFEVIVRDCSDGDPDDLSTCSVMPDLPLVLDYRGRYGRSIELLYTDPVDGSFYGYPYGVPAILTVKVDFGDIDIPELVALDSEQAIVVLAGDEALMTIMFVSEDDGPVTELPNTGTGSSLHQLPVHMFP